MWDESSFAKVCYGELRSSVFTQLVLGEVRSKLAPGSSLSSKKLTSCQDHHTELTVSSTELTVLASRKERGVRAAPLLILGQVLALILS